MKKTVKKKSTNTKKRKKTFLESVERTCRLGLSVRDIADVLDLSELRLNRCQKDPLFMDAIEKAESKPMLML